MAEAASALPVMAAPPRAQGHESQHAIGHGEGLWRGMLVFGVR